MDNKGKKVTLFYNIKYVYCGRTKANALFRISLKEKVNKTVKSEHSVMFNGIKLL